MMKKFDVFQLPDGSYRAIKYGFNWPSFFFNWIWCLFVARLYGWGGVWFGVLLLSGAFDRIASEPTTSTSGASLAAGIALINFVVVVGFGVWFSFNANEFRRRKYAQLGYTLLLQQVDAPNRENAISTARQKNPDQAVPIPQPNRNVAKGSQEHRKSTPKGAIICSSCGEETFANRPFCGKCGKPVESYIPPTKQPAAHHNGRSSGAITCPSCGEETFANRPFCGKCGKSLTEDNSEDAIKNKSDDTSTEVKQDQSDHDGLATDQGETIGASMTGEDWSDEFSILFEYDPIVKECHDELENINPQLSNQFREEVASDRKKASAIRDRLKEEHEKKLNPYTSGKLNEGLSEVRLLGPKAEVEFIRVIEVMGEDIDVDEVVGRLKEKYGDLLPPDDDRAELEYWGIEQIGDKFTLGDFKYESKNDAIVYAQIKLDNFLNNAPISKLEGILRSCGFTIETMNDGRYRVTSKSGTFINTTSDYLSGYIKGKISPKEIRQCEDFLVNK